MSRRALMFGSYDATLHPRVAVLRDGLAAHGWQVDELNVPLGASTADKVAAAGSVRAAAGLAGRQLRSWRGLLAGARARRRDPAVTDPAVADREAVDPEGVDVEGVDAKGVHPEVVVVGYLGHADVHLARALFRRSTIVLDHLVGLADTVGDRQLGGSLTQRGLGLVDAAALRAADLVVVDTPEQAAALPAGARSRAVVVPVGAGPAWYAAAERAAASATLCMESPVGHPDSYTSSGGRASLRVVFFGLFTPLQGTATIARAIALLHDEQVEFTIVGTGQDHAEARRIVGPNPRVRWIDWVPGDELPALVAGHDVCLGIFGVGPKAQRVVPTKVYQGLAAGCAVVTGDTPAAAVIGDGVVRVPCGDPEALAASLRLLASDEKVLADARDRARRKAADYTPAAATTALADRLAGPPPARRLPPLSLNAWLRWDVIDAQLAAIPSGDVLEIGPGEGAGACRLARWGRYTGVELSDRTRPITAARLAAQGTPGRLVATLDDLGADERFDLVCAFEVIEHIEDDRAALASWVARLRPGGTLLLSTPNEPERMGPHDEVAGHFRRYSAEGLSALAREAGLTDVDVIGVGYPFGYALEAFRNRTAARRLARTGVAAGGAGGDETTTGEAEVAEIEVADLDAAARTELSSSIMQPPAWSGSATRLASAPGRWLQRRWPERGTGLVLVGRAPR